MTRQDLPDYVNTLPDDTPFALVADELQKSRLVAEIKAGLDEIARGETVTNEEMKRRVAEWKRRR